jgi:hypothetical protein
VRYLLFLILVSFVVYANAQEVVHWQEDTQLVNTDFASHKTGVFPDKKMHGVNADITIGYNIAMSVYQFMLTKNFNKYVDVTFLPASSYYVVFDSASIDARIALANYQFDLAELHARRFRENIYENKKLFSDFKVLEEHFRSVYGAYNADFQSAVESSEFGEDVEALTNLHEAVKRELADLDEFCKQCKPIKKKKRK